MAMGLTDPGDDYFRAICDGDGEASRARALFLASRRTVTE